MALSLFAVNNGYLDDVEVKKVLPSRRPARLPQDQARRAADANRRRPRQLDKDDEGAVHAAVADVQEDRCFLHETARRSTLTEPHGDRFMAAAKRFAARSRAWRTRARSPRPWKWWPPPRCARRRTACARPVRTPTRFATSRPTWRRPIPSTRHPFIEAATTTKRVGFIVVTTDKGLCGGMNTNVLRSVTGKLKDWQAAGTADPGGGDRQQGSRLSQSHRRAGGVARHPIGRHAAPGKADRPGQGAAGRLRGRQDRRGVPGYTVSSTR